MWKNDEQNYSLVQLKNKVSLERSNEIYNEFI